MQRSPSRGSRLIIANTINDLTYRDITPESISVVDLFAFQELWSIEPGDVIVTARPLPEAFVAKVCCVLSLEQASFTCLSPNIAPALPLVPALLDSKLLEQYSGRGGMRIRACALDKPLLDLSFHLGLLIEDYESSPDVSVCKFVDGLNTKSGFRKLAASLGLPVADGFEFVSAPDVKTAVEAVLESHEEAIIKCDRGSGGGGQFRIQRDHLGNKSVKLEEMTSFVQRRSGTWATFAVEACLPLQLDPTIDVHVSEMGPRHLYVGAMNCVNGVFNGMTVPALGLSDRSLEELQHAAKRIGEVLCEKGYRGFFDIDAGLTSSGELCLFEANVRRTSTSLWSDVLPRIIGSSSHKDVQWCVRTETLPLGSDSSATSTPRASNSQNPKFSGKAFVWACSEETLSTLYLDIQRQYDVELVVDEPLAVVA